MNELCASRMKMPEGRMSKIKHLIFYGKTAFGPDSMADLDVSG